MWTTILQIDSNLHVTYNGASGSQLKAGGGGGSSIEISVHSCD